MDPIKVKVQVYYLGTVREEIVEVPEDAFRKHCWRPIASLMAAVKMELPFTEVERLARFGLRPEDKLRLLDACEETKEDKNEDYQCRQAEREDHRPDMDSVHDGCADRHTE